MGKVVHVHRDRPAYEVEFTTLDGKAAAVVTLKASQGAALALAENTRARELPQA